MNNLKNIVTISEVRDYWDKRPCNIRHSKLEVGTREYFDEVETRKYFIEPHILGFADFQNWKNKRVLEVGCGIGTDAVNFARSGAEYTGVELSRTSLDIAKKRFDVFGLKGDFYHLNGEEITKELIGRQYDLIYSFGVIHHSPNPRSIIHEIRQLIAPDGELRIMLYAKHSWKAAMIRADLDQYEAQAGCPIAFTYDKNDVEILLNDLFVPTKIQQDHIFPYRINNYVNYEYVRQPWFEAMPEQLFKALEKSLGWHLLINAKPI